MKSPKLTQFPQWRIHAKFSDPAISRHQRQLGDNFSRCRSEPNRHQNASWWIGIPLSRETRSSNRQSDGCDYWFALVSNFLFSFSKTRTFPILLSSLPLSMSLTNLLNDIMRSSLCWLIEYLSTSVSLYNSHYLICRDNRLIIQSIFSLLKCGCV